MPIPIGLDPEGPSIPRLPSTPPPAPRSVLPARMSAAPPVSGAPATTTSNPVAGAPPTPTADAGGITTKQVDAAAQGLSMAGGILEKLGDSGDQIPTDGQIGMQVGGAALKGAGTGASIGGTIGSVIPGVGTAIGAAAGAVIGATTGAIVGYFGAKSKARKIARLREAKKRHAEKQLNNAILDAKEQLNDQYMVQMGKQADAVEASIQQQQRKEGQLSARAQQFQSGKIEQGMKAKTSAAVAKYKQQALRSDVSSATHQRLRKGLERRGKAQEGKYASALRLLNSDINQTRQNIKSQESLAKALRARATTGLRDESGEIKATLDKKSTEAFAKARRKIEAM